MFENYCVNVNWLLEYSHERAQIVYILLEEMMDNVSSGSYNVAVFSLCFPRSIAITCIWPGLYSAALN